MLANEEVTADGRSDRGNHPVYKRPLRQWMLRITAYADRLIDDLDLVDWTDSIKLMQRNWIGRSVGAEVCFKVAKHDGLDIKVFTTRPDTLFGATYMVLAPEHPLVDALVANSWEGSPPAWRGLFGGDVSPPEAVARYREYAARKSELERQSEGREKTGVFIGAYAINPTTSEKIPIFIADYVLMGYGTGAIMAVPGQDERDWEFAKVFDAPDHPHRATARRIRRRQAVPRRRPGHQQRASRRTARRRSQGQDDRRPRTVAGVRARPRTSCATGCSAGSATGASRSRSSTTATTGPWHFPSRCSRSSYPTSSTSSRTSPTIPTRFPSRRSRAEDWVFVDLDLGDGTRTYRRETNTMPQWAGSCWYYLRYLDPTNEDAPFDPRVERYWSTGLRSDGTPAAGTVDLYVGGVEHAVLHLLYARFWHKVLYDLGYVSTIEPFQRLFNQGYVLAPAYVDSRGIYVEATDVEARDGAFVYRGEPVTRERQDGEEPEERRSLPTTSATSTAPTRCVCTRCSWGRSTRRDRGTPPTSSACSATSSGCGATSSTKRPARCT